MSCRMRKFGGLAIVGFFFTLDDIRVIIVLFFHFISIV